MSNTPQAALIILSAFLLMSCDERAPTTTPDMSKTTADMPALDAEADGAKTYRMEVWADNWFAAYAGESLIGEDSVPITTERSFNKEVFTFEATLPITINVILKDFKENDTGLEYIGKSNQQMGDGGFIAQIKDVKASATVGQTDASWRCLVIHRAPLETSCEKSSSPTVETCQSMIIEEPEGWKSAGFDSTGWPMATTYNEAQVSPKDGYDEISWDAAAKLIWGPSLTQDNTLLCTYVLSD